MNWKKWGIGNKLRFMNAVLLTNMLCVGLVGYWNIHRLTAYLDRALHVEVPSNRHFTLVDMYHDGIRGNVYTAYSGLLSNDRKMIEDANGEVREMQASMEEAFNLIGGLDIGPELNKEVASAREQVHAYTAHGIKMNEIAATGNLKSFQSELPQFQQTFENLEKTLGDLGDKIESGGKLVDEKATAFARQAFWIMTFILVLGFAIGTGLPWIIIRTLVATLQSTIQRLSHESVEVRGSATEIASSSDGLSTTTTQQAAALQETASSIEEMNAMLKKSADNASKSRSVSEDSQKASAKGQTAVQRMTHAIEEINQSNDAIMRQTDESNKKISAIVKVINEIGNKTKVINDIVFQTKLLSFNASVEAARAGEHGKGFAVVAEEVGNLAQMSGNAAKEISDMLQDSIRQVESIITETKSAVESLVAEGKAKVDTGGVVARECGEILDEVVRNVSSVNDMINEIASATREQSQGVSEITKAMNQLDNVTHQNSTTATQAARAAEGLSKQSESLLSVVRDLRSFVEGSSDQPHQLMEASTKPAFELRPITSHPHATETHKKRSKVASLGSRN